MMNYSNTTQVPNLLLDHYLPLLTYGELKIVLVIIRQTFGWIDQRTRKRKARDRISQSQFVVKTGLSKRIVSSALSSLITKNIVVATDARGNLLNAPKRKGRTHIFYSLNSLSAIVQTSVKNVPKPARKSGHNKTNYTKVTRNHPKGFAPIAGIINNMAVRP